MSVTPYEVHKDSIQWETRIDAEGRTHYLGYAAGVATLAVYRSNGRWWLNRLKSGYVESVGHSDLAPEAALELVIATESALDAAWVQAMTALR